MSMEKERMKLLEEIELLKKRLKVKEDLLQYAIDLNIVLSDTIENMKDSLNCEFGSGIYDNPHCNKKDIFRPRCENCQDWKLRR